MKTPVFYTFTNSKMQNLTITSDKLGTLENSFDFLDDVKKRKTKNKQDLWEYLDGFNFVNDEEI